MSKSPSKGPAFECRVARLLHHEGAFVRRAVDLQMQFGEAFTVTDIDVLALSLSGSLKPQVSIVECKTTESKSAPSHGDRLLWVSGVKQLVPGAVSHALATIKEASDNVRQLGHQLGAEVLDARDISHRERALGLDPDRLDGPHDPSLIEHETAAFKVAKDDPELRRVWSFVRSEFWFADTAYGLKRTFGALRVLQRRWHPGLPRDEARAIVWLAHEAVAAAIVAIVELAGQAYRQPPEVFDRLISLRLSEGLASHEVLSKLSGELDRYLMAVLRDSGADPSTQLDHLGALEPKLPGYAEPLIEVLHRVADSPRAAAGLPRLYDERLAGVRGSQVPDHQAIRPSAAMDRLLGTIGLFLEKQIQVPYDFVEAVHFRQPERGRTIDLRQSLPVVGPVSAEPPSLFSGLNVPTQEPKSSTEKQTGRLESLARRVELTGRFGVFSSTGHDADALWIELVNLSDEPFELLSGSGDASYYGRFSTDHRSTLAPNEPTRVEFALRVPEKNPEGAPVVLESLELNLELRSSKGRGSQTRIRADHARRTLG